MTQEIIPIDQRFTCMQIGKEFYSRVSAQFWNRFEVSLGSIEFCVSNLNLFLGTNKRAAQNLWTPC